MTGARLLLAASLAAAWCAPAAAQAEGPREAARDAHGRPLDGALSRAFAAPPPALPWLEGLVVAAAGELVVPEVEPEARARTEPTPARAALLRGVPARAVALLPAWPGRAFAPDPGGAIRLPASDRPLVVRIATSDGGAWAIDEVWLGPGEVRSLALEPPAWRSIRVSDGAGRPVAGARVVTLRSGPGRPAVAAVSETDASGIGRHRARVDLARVVVLAEPFALAAVWPGDLESAVQLEPARLARLEVVDERGQPLAGAGVATRIDPTIDQEGSTDDRGEVELRQLPAGPIRVLIDHRQHPPLLAEIDPAAGGVTRLSLERGLEIRGVVTCSDRSRIAGVLVEVRDTAGATWLEPRVTATDAQGRFAFAGLPDGALTLFARCTEAGKTWSGTVRDVAPGEQPVAIAIECDDPPPGAGAGRGG